MAYNPNINYLVPVLEVRIPPPVTIKSPGYGPVLTGHSQNKCFFSIMTKRTYWRINKLNFKYSKTSFEKNCFSAWASTLNTGLINKVDMVCLSPVGYDVNFNNLEFVYIIRCRNLN